MSAEPTLASLTAHIWSVLRIWRMSLPHDSVSCSIAARSTVRPSCDATSIMRVTSIRRSQRFCVDRGQRMTSVGKEQSGSPLTHKADVDAVIC